MTDLGHVGLVTSIVYSQQELITEGSVIKCGIIRPLKCPTQSFVAKSILLNTHSPIDIPKR